MIFGLSQTNLEIIGSDLVCFLSSISLFKEVSRSLILFWHAFFPAHVISQSRNLMLRIFALFYRQLVMANVFRLPEALSHYRGFLSTILEPQRCYVPT